ncbi:hypothetical protein ACFXGI_36395 [Streptomyces sp. NPDC059355]|uniref:hypothetical protein n=1 Tax=Streptomyces sp. NPDC059355 TaxID=3346811 RepID=UPI0036A58945
MRSARIEPVWPPTTGILPQGSSGIPRQAGTVFPRTSALSGISPRSSPETFPGCSTQEAADRLNRLPTSRSKQFEHVPAVGFPAVYRDFGLDAAARTGGGGRARCAAPGAAPGRVGLRAPRGQVCTARSSSV